MAKAPLTLRPWRLDQKEQPSVAELLDRVNQERGHFRDITASSLQEELAAEGGLELSNDEEEDAEDQEEADKQKQPSTREELYKVKFDMLQKVSLAHNEVMMALDFISLLESKDSPAGKQTMSQVLRDTVPTASLGTDIWKRMPNDAARDQSESALAHVVRLDALQKSADSILDAARTLEDNVRKETQYWSQVLTVADSGWNVCRLPGQAHKLGVRFGMNESAAEFSRGGIAVLNAGEDGTIILDRGTAPKPKVVQVTIRRDGNIIGRSTPPALSNGEVALEERIKHARDDLFAQELFREMEREARTMTGGTVETPGEAIALTIDDGEESLDARFELVLQDEASFAGYEQSESKDHLAQGLLCVTQLLLCQAHRDKVQRRSAVPAPMSDNSSDRSVLHILRPLTTLLFHHRCVRIMSARLNKLAETLRQAGIETILTIPRLWDTLPADIDNADGLLSTLTGTWDSQATIEIKSPSSNKSQLLSIELQSSCLDDSRSLFIITRRDSETRQEPSIDAALYSLDKVLATALSALLFADAASDWVFDGTTRCLERRLASGKLQPSRFTIQVDAQSGVLSWTGPSISKRWSLNEPIEQTMWQAWNMIK